MLFGDKIYKESDIVDPVSAVIPDSDTDEGIDFIAAQVDEILEVPALENMAYFDGGEEAQKAYMESSEVQALVEARKMSKKTFVRLNKNDDFTRRAHLASLILARNANDPLFKKLAINRMHERDLRKKIFQKYENKAKIIAKKSQTQHIKKMKKMPAFPKIKF